MSRRGDNIRKRADGRWEGRYRMVLENGEKRYRSIYGKSYGEVKEKLVKLLLDKTQSLNLQFLNSIGIWPFIVQSKKLKSQLYISSSLLILFSINILSNITSSIQLNYTII